MLALQGPPEAIDRVRPGQPAELVAICEKAMARAVEERYRGMDEMADDLRAYLEDRVVRAHRTGAVAEFRKWVRRNRMAAALAASLVVVLAVSGFAVAWVERARAEGERQYTDRALVTALLEEVDDLGPIHPDHARRRELWLEQARPVAARGARYRQELEELRSTGSPGAEEIGVGDRRWDNVEYVESVLEDLPGWVAEMRALQRSEGWSEREREIARQEEEALLRERDTFERRAQELHERADQRRSWVLPDAVGQRNHDHLQRFVADLDRLADPRSGQITRIAEDLRRARELESLSIEAHRPAWDEAIAAIGDVSVCPAYRGLALRPQVGLVPIGRDPESGLWEFWHVLSGERPRRDADGDFQLEASSGLLFVLLPGGSFVMGAQRSDPEAPGYDPEAAREEGPPHVVELAPFFMSKFEMTQGQWLAATGANPSMYLAGTRWGQGAAAEVIQRVHPVESLVWEETRTVLARYGLALPTEAQWEFACRSARSSNVFGTYDGYELHAPVDVFFPPNSFGLHDMQGNVAELCRDWYAPDYSDVEIAPGDGEIIGPFRGSRSVRGATWRDTPVSQLSSAQRRDSDLVSGNAVGARPVRLVDPWSRSPSCPSPCPPGKSSARAL